MLIIVDHTIPGEAKKNLLNFGELLEIQTTGITYPAISGHPDIFLTQIHDQLVVAPNLPEKYIRVLQDRKITIVFGKKPVGEKYPETAGYNAVVTQKYLMHNPKITDPSIIKIAGQKASIAVNQGYTRCNLIFLNDENAITSDRGIQNQLEKSGVNTIFLNPAGIQLPGFSHGFFGGCCGFYDSKLFVLGNPNRHSDGEKLKSFLDTLNIKLISLCDAPLFDGGGIFFLD